MEKEMKNIFLETQGKWHAILAHFGIDSSYLNGVHGPCPLCNSGKDRWRFDNLNGDGTWICSVCGSGGGISFLRKKFNWDFKKTCIEIRKIINECEVQIKPQVDNKKIQEYINSIWRESSEIKKNDPVWLYLQNRCGPLSEIPNSIRFHSSLYHSETKKLYPTMVCRMENGSLHRTYLTKEGFKADIPEQKKILGKTAPICLSNNKGAKHLVAEGIESALCATKFFDVDTIWSACNANGLIKFEWPNECNRLVICADQDINFVGQSAGYQLAQKLNASNHNAFVALPGTDGWDFADLWEFQCAFLNEF
jgi:putative DNA primase/helicase